MQPSTDTGRRLRIGVAGLGMAGGVMMPVIQNHPRLELAGAADRQPHLRRRFEGDFGLAADEDISELAARTDIEAIYVATPQEFHAEHASIAARCGKHVVVEKPMAMSLSDCDRMISSSKAAGTVLIVGHTHGFDPSVSAIRELIASGQLGRPVLLHGFNYTNFMYRPRRPEELDPDHGGGVIWNQLPHHLDVMRLIVGEPIRSVRAMTACVDRTRRVEGCYALFIEFTGGAVATAIYSGYDRFDSDEWCGWVGASGNAKQPAHGAARRALTGMGGENELAQRRTRWSFGGDALKAPQFVGQPHFGQIIVGCEHGEVRFSPAGLLFYGIDGMREIAVGGGDRPGHVAVWDELCAAVFDGVQPRHDGLFARGTVELCLAIAESARTRREVIMGA